MNRVSVEFDFLVSCVKAFFRPECACECERAASKVGDWQSVIALADYHRLAFVVHELISSHEMPAVPEHVRLALRQAHTAGAARLEFMLRECWLSLGCLASDGIATLLVRGPILAEQYYGNRCLRQCDDLDILIKESEYSTVAAALRNAGFLPNPLLPAEVEKAFVAGGWSVSYSKADHSAAIDIATRILPLNYAIDETPERWFDDAQLYSLDDERPIVRTLSPQNHLLASTMHGYKHLWKRLIWLADVAAVLRKLDKQQTRDAWETAESMRLGRILRFSCWEASRLGWLDTEVRLQRREERIFLKAELRLLQDAARGYEDESERISDFVLQMRLHSGFRARMNFTAAMLGKPTPTDFAQHSFSTSAAPSSFALAKIRRLMTKSIRARNSLTADRSQ